MKEGTKKLLIATGQIYGEAIYLAQISHAMATEFVDQANRAAALVISAMGLLLLLWSPVIINSSCIAQLSKCTMWLQLTNYMQVE